MFEKLRSITSHRLFLLVILLAALPVIIFMLGKQQEIRQRAAEIINPYQRFENTEFLSNQLLIKLKPEASQTIRSSAEKTPDLKLEGTETGQSQLNQINTEIGVETIEPVIPSGLLTGGKNGGRRGFNASQTNDVERWYKVTLKREKKILDTRKSKPKEEKESDIQRKSISSEKIKNDPDIQQLFIAMEEYKKSSLVEYVEPVFIYRTTLIPNDTDFSKLWGLHNTGQTGGKPDADIDAPEAWDKISNTAPIIVGVIDTGIDYRHPDLQNNIWINSGEIPNNGIDDDANGYKDDYYGYDFNINNPNPLDDNRHGTHVAGTIGAVSNNAFGVAGVAKNVKLMSLKFLDWQGSGLSVNAARAVVYATAMGAKLTNNSWGGAGYSQAVYDAISAANNQGVLFIAAAGNGDYLYNIGRDNDIYPFYPSNFNLPNVIAVASTDHNDNRSTFSNYGATTVDLGAPGSNIFSTVPNYGFTMISGTSMATPHIAGAAVLVWQKFPSFDHNQIKQKLLASVDVIPSMSGKTVSNGRLNLAKALEGQTLSPTPTPVASVNLSMTPNTGNIPFGQAFNVNVSLVNADHNLSGVDLTIKYDKEILELASFSASPALSSKLINRVNSADGTLRYTAVETGETAKQSTYNLGSITFVGKKDGAGAVAFSQTQITAIGIPVQIPNNNNDTAVYTIGTGQGVTDSSSLSPQPTKPNDKPTKLPPKKPTTPGDANGDKIVDIRDYNIWRDEFLRRNRSILPKTNADFNNDRKVDLLDFAIWRNAFNP